MVDDDVVMVRGTQSVTFVGFGIALQGDITQSEAHEADDDIVGSDGKGIICHADTITRCRLSGNGQIAVLYLQLTLQMDGATLVENDGACAFLPDGPAQRTLYGVLVVTVVI